jgi:UDP-glucose 4-epimerase
MRVLVTGGAGYIGSVITSELVDQNHEVIVFDDLRKGHRDAVRTEARFIQGNLLDQGSLRKVFREFQIDSVIHMAADSLVGESMAKPREYYHNNLEAGLLLLDAMCDAEIKNLVFSSTAATYGEPKKQPIEEMDATQPTNPYGETKLAFEKAMAWYSQSYEFRFTSLRYFNAAGATETNGEMHDPETHLIPAILQVAQGKKPYAEIFGDDYPTRDGTCVRDYIHVVDLARAHILALNPERTESRIYNLGCGGNGYSVREVLDTARKITGRPIPERVMPRRPGDPSTLIASSGKIRAELGWKPSFQNLDFIIESAWKWMQSHPNGYEK